MDGRLETALTSERPISRDTGHLSTPEKMLVVPDAAALAAGCGFCGAQSCALEVKCGGCETYYCSRYCKVQHWGGGGHSQVCVEAVSPTAETVRKASLEFSPRSEEDRRLLAAKKPHAHAHACPWQLFKTGSGSCLQGAQGGPP